MPEAYIVAATRTAGGRRDGRVSGWHPVDLAAVVLDDAVARAGVAPDAVDDAVDVDGRSMMVGSVDTNLG